MKQGSARTAALVSLVFSIMLISGVALAQGAYGSNVTASTSNTVTVSSSGTATVDNTKTTGVSATITGLTGVSNAVVTTQSLNAPNSGVNGFSTSGTAVYFDVHVSLPSGTTAPPGATITVCETNSAVASGDTLDYWSGSAWVAASGITITGSQICGTVPLSAVTGTNFVIAPPAVADYTWLYITLVVALVVIILVAVVLMRRKKRSP